MRFLASHQDDAITIQRVKDGETYVAVDGETIVATITVRRSGAGHDAVQWYERADVATFEQFAVDPPWQGKGIGRALMQVAEKAARDWGAAELALDTSEHATELIATYTRWGYRVVEEIDRAVTNYRSVVMSKRLADEEDVR